MTRSVVNLMSNTLITPSESSKEFSTIFQLGIKMDNKGVLALDDKKFSEALDKNFEQVMAVFGVRRGGR